MNTQQNQGIIGSVSWVQGNMMPGPDKPSSANPEKGIKREIHIFEVIKMTDLPSLQNSLYPSIPSKPVKVVKTSEDGSFKVGLPVGTYSVFTKEEGGFFASISNGKGEINPIEVTEGTFTEMKITINYKAAY
ncbi:carboxypeptidase regulatory-like domain-containing protein [Flammeovirgaceae bacterium SG7u.111]|nr:carboxypeptidase regulatory-like domain-containing protein [Flammeovirgaceae bacterium SG7u.132]WPO37046.1 carboxypeptidase regulatory-like domain-containing protein [Flammeovirgaceae bacterium SG7u.111]